MAEAAVGKDGSDIENTVNCTRRPATVTRITGFPIINIVRRQIIKKGFFPIKKITMRMCVFQDNLLFPNKNTLNFYTLQGQLQQTVTIKGNSIKSIYSVCPLHTDNLVIATDTGLYQVDITGNVISQLHGGVFIDIHVGEKHIAAINNSNTVYLWSRQDLSTLMFSFKCTHKIDNVLVKEEFLYFSNTSATDSEEIRKYDLKGTLLQSSGVSGAVGGAGALNVPILCAVDCEDNLLVADFGNNRFQLLSTRTGRWSLLSDQLNITWPVDAVFVADTLYVLTFGGVVILTYN